MDCYERIKVLGRGAYGVAVLARSKKGHSKDDRFEPLRVIKEIDLSPMAPATRSDAHSEVDVLRSLRHVNIVGYVDTFWDTNRLCIVMEYADGGDLAATIGQRREAVAQGQATNFPEAEVLSTFVQCCLGLQHTHSRRILHRDLKSQNIFLTKAGTVKLGDFGIAKVLDHTTAKRETRVGTPYYISPEVCDNKPYGLKADVWALGVVLYELFALEPPFRAGNLVTLVLRIIGSEPKELPVMYGSEARDLVVRLLRKDPDARPTCDELLALPALLSAAASMATQAPVRPASEDDGQVCAKIATATQAPGEQQQNSWELPTLPGSEFDTLPIVSSSPCATLPLPGAEGSSQSDKAAIDELFLSGHDTTLPLAATALASELPTDPSEAVVQLLGILETDAAPQATYASNQTEQQQMQEAETTAPCIALIGSRRASKAPPLEEPARWMVTKTMQPSQQDFDETRLVIPAAAAVAHRGDVHTSRIHDNGRHHPLPTPQQALDDEFKQLLLYQAASEAHEQQKHQEIQAHRLALLRDLHTRVASEVKATPLRPNVIDTAAQDQNVTVAQSLSPSKADPGQSPISPNFGLTAMVNLLSDEVLPPLKRPPRPRRDSHALQATTTPTTANPNEQETIATEQPMFRLHKVDANDWKSQLVARRPYSFADEKYDVQGSSPTASSSSKMHRQSRLSSPLVNGSPRATAKGKAYPCLVPKSGVTFAVSSGSPPPSSYGQTGRKPRSPLLGVAAGFTLSAAASRNATASTAAQSYASPHVTYRGQLDRTQSKGGAVRAYGSNSASGANPPARAPAAQPPYSGSPAPAAIYSGLSSASRDMRRRAVSTPGLRNGASPPPQESAQQSSRRRAKPEQPVLSPPVSPTARCSVVVTTTVAEAAGPFVARRVPTARRSPLLARA